MSTQLLDKAYQKALTSTLGVPPTINQLLQAVQKSGVSRPAVIAYLRSKQIHAQFTTARKIPVYQTVSVPRAGVFFVDYAEFHKSQARPYNSGYTGFLVCVENMTNKLFVFPCKGKSTTEWEAAMQLLIENTGYVRTVYSDRDSVATSPNFQQTMAIKYNINWYFLKRNSKSYLAERYIRYVKERLSQAMLLTKSHNWIQFVPGVIKAYNNETVPGTSYKRKTIQPKNFNNFLSQVLKCKDPELVFNRARIAPFTQPSWNKALFAFEPGDKVLLARKSNWQDKATGNRFFKSSHHGTFSSTVYTITGRQLRATKGFKRYVALYSVSDLDAWFYEQELRRL